MTETKCPKCESQKFRLNGTTKKGTVRYRCQDCGKSWSDRPIGRPLKGAIAMTNAERQRRYRQKKKVQD